jgi:hypothetical protein
MCGGIKIMIIILMQDYVPISTTLNAARQYYEASLTPHSFLNFFRYLVVKWAIGVVISHCIELTDCHKNHKT